MPHQVESPKPRLRSLPPTGSEHTYRVGFATLLREGKESGFVRKFGLFDGHIFEFAGFEYFSAFEALNEFGVFFAGHDLHAWMLAFWHVTSLLGELGRRDWIHKSGLFSGPSGPERILPEFVRYCRTADLVVKSLDSMFGGYDVRTLTTDDSFLKQPFSIVRDSNTPSRLPVSCLPLNSYISPLISLTWLRLLAFASLGL